MLKKLESSREKAYNKRSRARNFDLEEGDKVRIQDPVTKKWTERGTISKILPHRRLEISFRSGLVADRNRSQVRRADADCFAGGGGGEDGDEDEENDVGQVRRGTRVRRAPDRLGFT